MTANTAINAMPYPLLTDVKDEVAQFSAFSAVADTRYVPRYLTAGARDSANPSPVQGQLAYTSTEQMLTYRGSSGWNNIHHANVVRKTNPQSVTSSTVQVPDTQLKLSLQPNSRYLVETILMINGAAVTTGGVAISWPALATLTNGSRTILGMQNIAANTDPLNALLLSNFPGQNANGYGTAGTSTPVTVHEVLHLETSSSAVNLVMNWAQLISSATPSTVMAGSYLKYWKIS